MGLDSENKCLDQPRSTEPQLLDPSKRSPGRVSVALRRGLVFVTSAIRSCSLLRCESSVFQLEQTTNSNSTLTSTVLYAIQQTRTSIACCETHPFHRSSFHPFVLPPDSACLFFAALAAATAKFLALGPFPAPVRLTFPSSLLNES